MYRRMLGTKQPKSVVRRSIAYPQQQTCRDGAKRTVWCHVVWLHCREVPGLRLETSPEKVGLTWSHWVMMVMSF